MREADRLRDIRQSGLPTPVAFALYRAGYRNVGQVLNSSYMELVSTVPRLGKRGLACIGILAGLVFIRDCSPAHVAQECLWHYHGIGTWRSPREPKQGRLA